MNTPAQQTILQLLKDFSQATVKSVHYPDNQSANKRVDTTAKKLLKALNIEPTQENINIATGDF